MLGDKSAGGTSLGCEARSVAPWRGQARPRQWVGHGVDPEAGGATWTPGRERGANVAPNAAPGKLRDLELGKRRRVAWWHKVSS
jgi:hypothetical protein